ncbi:MAG TPA: sensor domain-containing phosphodiesterase [Eubacteriaceae bacterium]|nr:sensor domain-containing phosphodiesterase [Eubacteriaceae bacterium]
MLEVAMNSNPSNPHTNENDNRNTGSRQGKSKGKKVASFVLLFLLLSMIFLGFSWSRHRQETRMEAIQLAESLGSIFHVEHISSISREADGANEQNTDYQLYKRNLMQLKETTQDIDFAYLLAERNGEVLILMDSEPEDSPKYSPPGQIYEEVDSTVKEPFETGETVITDPVADRWGNWVSVLVPVVDEATGETIALFGMDYDAWEWKEGILVKMIPDVVVLISILLLSGLFLRMRNQQNELKRLSKRLGYDEAMFRGVFNQAPIGIAIMEGPRFVTKRETGHSTVNPMFQSILGRSEKELENVEWRTITHPDDLPEDLDQYEKFRKGEIPGYSMEKRYVRPDGQSVWTYMVVSRLTDLPDSSNLHLCLLQDISARKEAEAVLEESERSKSLLLSNLPGMAYRCKYDWHWTMLFVSDGCYELTGYHPDDLVQNRRVAFNQLISPRYHRILWEEWNQAIEQERPFRSEYEIITAGGERKWVLEVGEGVLNARGEVEALEGIILDITERKQMEEQLRYQSEHDLWTTLYNRRSLERRLKEEDDESLRHKRALIAINVSPMQLLSMIYGFDYSQKALKSVANVLSSLCTKDRELYYTYEYRFVFYVKKVESREELEEFTQEIIKKVKGVLASDRINGGIGAVEIEARQKTDSSEFVDELFQQLLIVSEQAVQSNEKEWQVLFFNEQMTETIQREEVLIQEMEDVAKGNRTDRLYLLFQPLLDVKSGRISKFEALARFHSDAYGFISPVEFIPLAERTRLIIPLGWLILQKAFKFLCELNEKAEQSIAMNANISVIQLLKTDFIEEFIDLMQKMGVSAENITVELTESVFATNLADVNKVLEGLRSYGVQVAIDDFGTGYSSLSRERDLHVDCLKIDKSFIDRLLILDRKQTIVGDIISMGHKMGHQVVAEGVEYESQFDYLRESGCDLIQGYYIGKPMAKEEAEDLITDQWTEK